MKPKLTPQQKRAQNILHRQVQDIVSKDLNGIPINIMDIGKVFAAAEAAAAAGEDVRAAVIATYRELAFKGGLR